MFILSPEHPGCVLVGTRRGSDGAGTLALPGGHLEMHESFERCAAREVLEETALELPAPVHAHTISCSRPEAQYHYVVGVVVAVLPPGAGPPLNLEPHKCDGWEWAEWAGGARWEGPVFWPLAQLRSEGFDPWAHCPPPPLPEWTAVLQRSAERVSLWVPPPAAADRRGAHRHARSREWEDAAWRREAGWQGTDLVHAADASVRVLGYWWDPAARTLTGAVHFTRRAESHRGLCHGGAMTSALDDVLGHAAFLSGAGPWTGATARLSITLKAPVPVDATLRVVGTVHDVAERRGGGSKVQIRARLEDASAAVFAEMEGLSVLGVRLSKDEPDAVDARRWSVERSGESARRSSGWELA